MLVTVAICTHNRATSLGQTLEQLTRLLVPEGAAWELLVVNNNCTDETDAVIERFIGRLPIRRLVQPTPGLAAARNAAVASARGDVIAFTDDDCIVAPDWLRAIVTRMASGSIAGLSGRVELFDERDLPVTILRDRDEAALATPQEVMRLKQGCNMAFAAEVFRAVGTFDERFGAGTTLHAAEDTDFFYRCYRHGLTLRYCPEVVVYHNHGRRTGDAVRRLRKGYRIGRGAFYCKHLLRGDPVVRGLLAADARGSVGALARALWEPRRVRDRWARLWYALRGGAMLYAVERGQRGHRVP